MSTYPSNTDQPLWKFLELQGAAQEMMGNELSDIQRHSELPRALAHWRNAIQLYDAAHRLAFGAEGSSFELMANLASRQSELRARIGSYEGQKTLASEQAYAWNSLSAEGQHAVRECARTGYQQEVFQGRFRRYNIYQREGAVFVEEERMRIPIIDGIPDPTLMVVRGSREQKA